MLEAQSGIENGNVGQPYLLVDNSRLEYWKSKLATLTSRKTVGVCWRSGLMGKLRYGVISAQSLVDIFSDLDCAVVNVQYSFQQQELDLIRSALGDRFIHFPEIDLKNDQDDLAALLKALDLVFSATTAVFDLAGSIGVNTLSFAYLAGNENYKMFGKPYNLMFPTVKFLGEKNKLPDDSIEYFKSNIVNALAN